MTTQNRPGQSDGSYTCPLFWPVGRHFRPQDIQWTASTPASPLNWAYARNK